MKTKSLLATTALLATICGSSADAALLAAFNFNNGQITPDSTIFGSFNSSGTEELFNAGTIRFTHDH